MGKDIPKYINTLNRWDVVSQNPIIYICIILQYVSLYTDKYIIYIYIPREST